MKNTKKALLAALVCSAAIAGVAGLAACNNGNGGNGGNGGEGGHSHDWNAWTVITAPTDDTEGKATRTCNNPGCDAEKDDKELTLPVLDEAYGTPVTKTAADCATDGVLTYTYNNGADGEDAVAVTFDVNIGKDTNVHDYVYTSKGPVGHGGVCSRNEEHTSETEEHDTDGVNGGCAACGVEKINFTEADTQPEGEATRYAFVAEKSGYYEIWGDTDVLLPNFVPGVALGIMIGTLEGSGELNEVAYMAAEMYLWAGTYYIDTISSGTFTVVLVEAHEHTGKAEWTSDARGHWHAADCEHEDAIVGFAKHDFGAWSEFDEEGTANRECACGYKDYQITGTLIEGETDGMSGETSTVVVAETNNFIAIIGAAREGFGNNYEILAQFFDMTNESGSKKSYTFKVLNDDTKLYLYVGEDTIELTEKGKTYTVELEADETFYFDVTTNDEEGYENYSIEAAFRIIVEDAA